MTCARSSRSGPVQRPQGPGLPGRLHQTFEVRPGEAPATPDSPDGYWALSLAREPSQGVSSHLQHRGDLLGAQSRRWPNASGGPQRRRRFERGLDPSANVGRHLKDRSHQVFDLLPDHRHSVGSKSVDRCQRHVLVAILLIVHGLSERLDERSAPGSLNSLPELLDGVGAAMHVGLKHEPSPSSFAATTMPVETHSPFVRTTVFGTVRRPCGRHRPCTGVLGRRSRKTCRGREDVEPGKLTSA